MEKIQSLPEKEGTFTFNFDSDDIRALSTAIVEELRDLGSKNSVGKDNTVDSTLPFFRRSSPGQLPTKMTERLLRTHGLALPFRVDWNSALHYTKKRKPFASSKKRELLLLSGIAPTASIRSRRCPVISAPNRASYFAVAVDGALGTLAACWQGLFWRIASSTRPSLLILYTIGCWAPNTKLLKKHWVCLRVRQLIGQTTCERPVRVIC